MHPETLACICVRSSGQVPDRRLKCRLSHSLFPDPYSGVHLLFNLRDCLAPPPGGDLAFIQLVDLSSRSTMSDVSSLLLSIGLCDEKGHDLPFGLRYKYPHEHTDWSRESSVDESGLEAECKQHWWGGVTKRLKQCLFLLEALTYQVAIPRSELTRKVTGPVRTRPSISIHTIA